MNSFLEVVSTLVSVCLLCVILYLPFLLVNVFSQSNYHNPQFLTKYKELGNVLKLSKKSSTLTLHFYSVFVMRRLCFVLIIFFLALFPKLQTVLLASLSVLMIMYLLFYRPFK